MHQMQPNTTIIHRTPEAAPSIIFDSGHIRTDVRLPKKTNHIYTQTQYLYATLVYDFVRS